MSKFIVNGGNRLYGKVRVGGAKNALLPLLAAALLTSEKTVFHDCPDLTDITNMLEILKVLGVDVSREGSDVSVSGGVKRSEIPAGLAKAIRSSVFLLGSVISTARTARVAYPGGCDIGLRPIDIHIKGLRELNIDIEEQNGFINCKADRIKGADIHLDKISVGATENIMMAAVLAEGRTTIRNAAREPEIVDLAAFLTKMGAKIKGAGGAAIVVDGVSSLHGAEYTPMPDRIAAGTLLTAVALTGGEVELENVVPEHIAALTSKLSKSACKIKSFYDRITVSGNGKCRPIDLETSPYPGFPTDMQPQVMTLASVASGTSLIVENIFETRFKHVPELRKMGADITVRGDMAIVRGVPKLHEAEVSATDLRGGAAMVLAGLAADGVTVVNDISHIDRGYERFEETLTALGAKITRVEYE